MDLRTVICFILQLTTFLVEAQKIQELATDRPDQSNAPVLVPAGSLQIESGVAMENDNSGMQKLINYTFNDMLLRIGVNDNFEIRAGVGYLGVDSVEEGKSLQKGFAPFYVGTKIKLADEEGMWPQAALITHVALRSGSFGFSPAYTGADVTIALLNTLSERFALCYNVGIKWSGDTAAPTFTYSVSTSFKVTEQVGVFIEPYGFFPERDQADHRIDSGFTWKIRQLLQVDIAGGIGCCNKSPTYFFTTGLSFRFLK